MFYTDLPAYNKAWVWRGDDTWWRRWQQVLEVLPEFVEIVTWNDFGESHYVGPIYHPGVPNTPTANATAYVDGYSHQAWLRTLPYQIAAYKHAYNPTNPAPKVAKDKIVYWYRNAPATAGNTKVTGNNCKSDINLFGYQTCFAVSDVLQDSIFAIVLATKSVTATISIGSGEPTVFLNLTAGIKFISRPFSGETGKVKVSLSSGAHGEGPAIVSEPVRGVANFNAYVQCAGGC
ncbi:Glucan endo-1,3-alpha-glucosidase agn1 [Elasticomyces elasticus]|nr:Glucan endo-1,3-alpha-glucosidase agn1 [Elasticomyces elasticus]KAK4967321.1 Glucan endo-1,3-alpha-glucosidase agn1 [Elasticomyces elasticus]